MITVNCQEYSGLFGDECNKLLEMGRVKMEKIDLKEAIKKLMEKVKGGRGSVGVFFLQHSQEMAGQGEKVKELEVRTVVDVHHCPTMDHVKLLVGEEEEKFEQVVLVSCSGAGNPFAKVVERKLEGLRSEAFTVTTPNLEFEVGFSRPQNLAQLICKMVKGEEGYQEACRECVGASVTGVSQYV